MKIIMTAPRGFCAGVDRAIAIVDEAIRLLPPPIYVNHEIVHNSHVIKSFSDKGVIFVEDLATVPDGASLIFNAHGVPPALVEEAKRRGMKTIDATCPLVTKVHFEAIRYAKAGYDIILVGHAGHPEVIGVLGEAPDRIHLVEDAAAAAKMEFPASARLAYITQTTLSVDDCRVVIDALKQRFPNIEEPKKSDICYATTNRQEAIKIVAGEVQVFLIVGSRNSSNSNRLREVSEAVGCPAFLVNSADEVDASWFRPEHTVGISAGASTPEHVVQSVVGRLRQLFPIDSFEERVTRIEDEKFSLPRFN